jgi:hypothetical protein
MGKKRVFVSCGQDSSEELALGHGVIALIDRAGMSGFFADQVHSATDLNSEVFRALQRCDAFLAILHCRGDVQYRSHPPKPRASVWVQQEIAVLCYRKFLQQQHLPIRVYSQSGILLEGVMRTAIVNPIEFEKDEEVLADVEKWLHGSEFSEHPVVARRADLFRIRVENLSKETWLFLEILAAHTRGAGEIAKAYMVYADFKRILAEGRNVDERELEHRLTTAFQEAREADLIFEVPDRLQGQHDLGIRNQWWDLLLDELRIEGRSI